MADETPKTDEVEADAAKLAAGIEVQSGRKTRIQLQPSVFTSLRWGQKECRVGEEVELRAELAPSASGTVQFTIYEHDADGEHDEVAKVEAAVEGGKATARWKALYVDDRDDVESDEELEKLGFTFPEFMFEAVLGEAKKRSGEAEGELLHMTALLDLRFLTADGQPSPDAPFVLTQADGKVSEGTGDGAGKHEQDGVVPGPVFVELDIF